MVDCGGVAASARRLVGASLGHACGAEHGRAQQRRVEHLRATPKARAVPSRPRHNGRTLKLRIERAAPFSLKRAAH